MLNSWCSYTFFKIWSPCSFPFRPYCREEYLFVSEQSGPSLLPVDVDNMDNRQKHDREMEIGEPTSKALKKPRQEQQKRAIMDMCSFYRTATQYLTNHLPIANELLHPSMYKEDPARQVIRETAKKLPQIIR